MISNTEIEQLRQYFAPVAEVLTELPTAAEIKDLSEVILKQSDGTYDKYQMVEGSWKKIADLT